jgi:hypothetical protein
MQASCNACMATISDQPPVGAVVLEEGCPKRYGQLGHLVIHPRTHTQ